MAPSHTAHSGASHNQEQLLAAEKGLDRLMDDDVDGARKLLKGQEDSPYALAGLGICEFLTAAIGMEDERLASSMEALALAEKSARKHKASSTDMDQGQWWTQAGMEYEVLVADVVTAQSLLHILSESYVEYMRAMWKLNSAFKHFTTIYKAVFPNDVTASSSLASIITDLNEKYHAAQLSHAVKHASLQGSSSKWPLGRLKSAVPSKVSSVSDLASLGSKGKQRSTSINGSTGGKTATTSMPVSSQSSIHSVSPPDETGNHSPNELVTAAVPQAMWAESPLTSFVVSGGAFGHAIFELVFALMPPKARRMFSWLGYGTGDRKKALKLLELTALTGVDVHGAFAALALCSYYSSILVSSGWQSQRQQLFQACHAVADRAVQKHPEGKLWLVNKAKLVRLEGDVEKAASMLEGGLSKPSGFRQATSTLQYELCWVQLSLHRYADASVGFKRMIDLNSWSHSTYYALAASCLHELAQRTVEQEKEMRALYAKIPEGFNKKRFMGQPPSSEVYLEKRIKFYRAKTDKWIAAGRLKSGAEWHDSITISIALELSLFWNQFAHYPQNTLQELVGRLEGYMTAAPTLLETPDEITLCASILGAACIALKDFSKARQYFVQAEGLTSKLGEAYTYLNALSRLYAAILECQEAEHNTGKAEDRTYWKGKFAIAEGKIDAMFTYASYDMQGRVEGRGQMLRAEITERKLRMGIA